MLPHVITFPDIDPVAFSVFGFEIHWYAITYLIGFALAYVLMRRRLRHEPFRSIREPKRYDVGDVEDVLMYSIIGVLVGGRIGFTLFYQPAYYLQHPLEIITGIRTGGMSFHGGVIGVILGLVFYAWRRKIPFLQLTDLLVPAVPLGLMCGRIGNFINGELWGRPASESLPWAMIFPTGGDIPRHPSQLYEAFLEGLLLFVLLWLYARKPRYRGQVSAFFLMGYGLARFFVEYFRQPDDYLGLLALGMSMGQWLSLPMILGGLVIFVWAQNKRLSDVNPDADDDDEENDDDDAAESEDSDDDETDDEEASDKDENEDSTDDEPVEKSVESAEDDAKRK